MKKKMDFGSNWPWYWSYRPASGAAGRKERGKEEILDLEEY